jgi:hypothetical protein
VNALNAEDLEPVWRGFAKRGMGVGAVAPPQSSIDFTGVIENFSLLRLSIQPGSFNFGEVAIGDIRTRTSTIKNTGALDLAVSFPEPPQIGNQARFKWTASDQRQQTGSNQRL